MKKKTIPKGIYAVITEKFCRNGSAVSTLEQVLDAGVKLIQLREKDYPKSRVISMTKVYRKLTKKAGAMLIINDYPDIAALVNADGVHLGRSDPGLSEVKRKYPYLITGMSTHNMKEALLAVKQGADYINIGPVFPTKTKNTGKYRPLGCARLKKIVKRTEVPFTVMGGIKEENITKVRQAGARTFAMITEITMAENIKDKIDALTKQIKKPKTGKRGLR